MDHRQTYDEYREMLDRHLTTVTAGRTPASLYEPTSYVLEGGGKRVRGVLVMLACRAVGGDPDRALDAAAAVEILHNFTLVHDDIMDRAPTRRGRETVHTRWDEGTAILVGDVMIGLAQLLLLKNAAERTNELLCSFARGIVDVCEGQALDREYETRSDIGEEEYLEMIAMKTGRLAEMAAEIGGHVGGGTEKQIDCLRAYARHLGLAFQIQDDLLDLTADEEALGKEIGKDIQEGKRTWLVVRAGTCDLSSEDRTLLRRLLDTPGLPVDEVPTIREMFDRNGILKDASEAVAAHSRKAIEALHELPESEGRDSLEWLCRMLVDRLH